METYRPLRFPFFGFEAKKVMIESIYSQHVGMNSPSIGTWTVVNVGNVGLLRGH